MDAHVTSFAHVTKYVYTSKNRPLISPHVEIFSKKDPVPIVPGRFLGFAHPSNEKHIVNSGTANGDWYACDGSDNTSQNCSTGAVKNIFDGNLGDHYGPYGGVTMRC